MSDQQACEMSAAEKKRDRTRCWHPGCGRRAWLMDWCGWKWCFGHWFWHWRWGDPGFSWWRFKTTRIFF